MKNIPYNSANKTYFTFLIAVIVWLFTINSQRASAQQDSQYTNYMYNTQVINPAYVGSRAQTTAQMLYRNQWVGLDGAPRTLNFGFHTPTGKNQKVGLGLSFFNDEIGPANESNIAADISYRINLSRTRTKLAFGLKGGISLLNIDYNKLTLMDDGDDVFQNNIDNRLTPIVGAGLFLYSPRLWYVGISTPNMLSTTHYDDVRVSNVTEKMHLYTTAGYVFDLSANTQFKPALMVKMVAGSPIEVDVSANFRFNKKLTFGLGYRLGDTYSGLAAFQVAQGILIGYSYDYGSQGLVNYNSGSHEVFLRFEFGAGNNGGRLIIPRFF